MRGEVFELENGDRVQLGTVGYNHVEFEFIVEGTGLDTDTSVTQVPEDVDLDADVYAPINRNYPQEGGETRVEVVEAPSTISKLERDKILRQGDKPRRTDDDWLSKL